MTSENSPTKGETNNEYASTTMRHFCFERRPSMLSYDSLDDNQNCLVCLEPFNPGDSLYELPCGHKYHTHCVRAWVMRKRECPKCLSMLPDSPLATSVSSSASTVEPSSMVICPRRFWERDRCITNCRHCNAPFTFFRRKHHCRVCGKIFCSKCCRGSFWREFRVCEQCHENA